MKLKKFIAVVLCAALVFSMAIPTFAESNANASAQAANQVAFTENSESANNAQINQLASIEMNETVLNQAALAKTTLSKTDQSKTSQSKKITYKVKYYANNGTSRTYTQTGFVYGKAKKLLKASASAISKFKKSGMYISSWNTKANGKGKTYSLGQKVSKLTKVNNKTVKLYAQWSNKTVVTCYMYSSSNTKSHDILQIGGSQNKNLKLVGMCKLNLNKQYTYSEGKNPCFKYAKYFKKVMFKEYIHPKYCTNWFSDFKKLTKITGMKKYLDTSNCVSMQNMFGGCNSVTSLDVTGFDTSKVKTMRSMFFECYALKTLDVTGFDTSKVKSMHTMFYKCKALKTLDVTGFDTSNATDLEGMFNGDKSLKALDTSHFDTSKVTNMSALFYGCENVTKLDVSSFDTSKVTDMSGMFGECINLEALDVTDLDTSKVTDMNYMFEGLEKVTSLDLSDFDTSNVTDMDDMFACCFALKTLNLSSFDTSNVTDISYMFNSLESITTLDLSCFDTSNVTDMNSVFDGSTALTSLDLSGWDTSKVTNMDDLFNGCKSLETLDLSGFDTSNVTITDKMFGSCYALKTIYAGDWDLSKVTDTSKMFADMSESEIGNLTGGEGTAWDSSNENDATYAHVDGGEKNPGYFTEKTEFLLKLSALDGVASVKKIEQNEEIYAEKYMVYFTQPVDWENPDEGTFEQSVEIAYAGDDEITNYCTDGYCLLDKFYGKDYFSRNDSCELAKMNGGNNIYIEYRYFADSAPVGLSNDSTDLWEYLTVENAAKDFDNIIEQLSTILTGKTTFSGISKGGFTTNTMAYYYPHLCDAYVAYVGPLCNGPEDTAFIKNIYESIGDLGYGEEKAAKMRQEMLDFQVLCIENRDELEDMCWQKAMKDGNTYREYVTKGILYDMTVLNFAIEFWQYGRDFTLIKNILAMPDNTEAEHTALINNTFNLLTMISDVGTWATNSVFFPYYVQAETQMGENLQDFSYLRKAVIEKTGTDMLVVTEEMQGELWENMIFTKEQKEAFQYDSTLRNNMISWSKTTDAHLIMIYGGCDTWYSVRIPDTDNENVHSYVKKDGCHSSAKLETLAEEDKNEAMSLLNEWLK